MVSDPIGVPVIMDGTTHGMILGTIHGIMEDGIAAGIIHGAMAFMAGVILTMVGEAVMVAGTTLGMHL